MMKRFVLLLAGAMPAMLAQDSSGNRMLSGTYRFREIAIVNFDANGNPVETVAASGAITFDGAGHYVANGSTLDSAASTRSPQTLSTYGSYAISAGGSGSMTNPLNPLDPSAAIFGATGQGLFIGSSTEGEWNNLFVAIPQGVPDSASAFSFGTLDFTVSPSQATMQFSAQAASGKAISYSADGNFALGWTPGGYDLLFGIRAGGDVLKGFYYVAGLQSTAASSDPCGPLNSFYGSLVADGAGNQIAHQRIASPLCYVADFETDDSILPDGAHFVASAAGAVFMGVGGAGVSSLTIGIRANDTQPSGVYLNPIGIANAASFAPATASIAPGELIVLYGSGLAASTVAMQGGQTFPPTLGGVRVLINGIPAPIYFVSPSQVAALVPMSIRSGPVTIQVINQGVASNTIAAFAAPAMPGIFTQSANGLGYAAAIHAASGQLVTAANPAVPGEFIAIFATGLGTVAPAAADGAPGVLSNTDHAVTVRFDDYNHGVFQNANVTYAGLAPGLAGLYQVNLQVPASVGPGDVYLEVAAGSADVNQVTIPVTTAPRAPAPPDSMPGNATAIRP